LGDKSYLEEKGQSFDQEKESIFRIGRGRDLSEARPRNYYQLAVIEEMIT